MELEKEVGKIKDEIESGIKKAEGDISEKTTTAALEEAVKTLAKKGIATDDIMNQIQAKFSDLDINKIKEVVDKVLKKEEKKEEKAEEKAEKKAE